MALTASELVTAIESGDRTAETALVEKYSRGVRLILSQMSSNKHAVDDLYQETFRRLIQKIRTRQIREPEKLAGFVASLAKNLAIESFRRSASRLEDPSGDVHCPNPSPLQSMLAKEKAAIARQVLDHMECERDREILRRFYIHEEDKEQICVELSLSSLHFNRVLYRARERYRALYIKWNEERLG